MQHDFEVYGTKGALRFSQERLNELHYFDAGDPAGKRGFRRIEAGPDHPPYGRFCVAPGHQIGFNDLKAIEIAGFAVHLHGRADGLRRAEDGALVVEEIKSTAEDRRAPRHYLRQVRLRVHSNGTRENR